MRQAGRVTRPRHDATGTLHLGGDWCIGQRIEAAWDSGTAIAADILAHP